MCPGVSPKGVLLTVYMEQDFENKMLLILFWRLSEFMESLRQRVKIKKKHEGMIKANILEKTDNGKIRENFWVITRELIEKNRKLRYILGHCY